MAHGCLSFTKDSTYQMLLEFLKHRKSFQHLRFVSLIALANNSPHSLTFTCISVFGYHLACRFAFRDFFNLALRVSVHHCLPHLHIFCFSVDP